MDYDTIKAVVLNWKVRHFVVGVLVFICLMKPDLFSGAVIGIIAMYCWNHAGTKRLDDIKPRKSGKQR